MPSTGPEEGAAVPGIGNRDSGLVRVAVGVLRRADGQVLIAQRPQGKEAAGWWEFPGGKVETGESVESALARELQEELGVVVREARRLIRLRHADAHKSVELDTWLVEAWDGEPQSREGQSIAWCRPDALPERQLLPADGPIVSALQLPAQYVLTPPRADRLLLRNALATLPRGCLLRLRLPRLDDADYGGLALSLKGDCEPLGIRLVLDRSPALSASLGLGWHGSEAAMRTLRSRPLPDALPVLASCHDADGLARAAQLGADAALLGSVNETPTHPDGSVLGWTRFESLVTAATLPVYAIGGVGPGQLDRAWRAGAQGVAGISAWWPRV